MDKLNEALDGTFHLEYSKKRLYDKEYNDYRRRWAYVGSKYRVLEFPIHLDIETNNTCNLRCKFCMRRQLSFSTHEYLKFADWCKYINEGLKYKVFASIKPNYRGEPTMHPQLPMFFEWAKERGVRDILMNTNGKYRHDLIYEMGGFIDELAFSIDAFDSDVYDKVRPGGNYNSLLVNVSNALRLRRRYPNLRIRVAFVKQKANMHQVKDFIDHWKARRVDKIVVNNAYNPGQKGNYQGAVKWELNESWVCPQLFQRLVVGFDGEVLPCCGSYDNSLSLGNIKKSQLTLHDFWHSDKLNNLRRLHKEHKFMEIPTCKTCALSHRVVEERV